MDIVNIIAVVTGPIFLFSVSFTGSPCVSGSARLWVGLVSTPNWFGQCAVCLDLLSWCCAFAAETDDMRFRSRKLRPNHAASNPAIALLLQSTRLVGRVAILGR